MALMTVLPMHAHQLPHPGRPPHSSHSDTLRKRGSLLHHSEPKLTPNRSFELGFSPICIVTFGGHAHEVIWLWFGCGRDVVYVRLRTQMLVHHSSAAHSVSRLGSRFDLYSAPCLPRHMHAVQQALSAIGASQQQHNQRLRCSVSCLASAEGAQAAKARKQAPTFVEVFRGAAQYVKSHRNQTVVVCLPSEVKKSFKNPCYMLVTHVDTGATLKVQGKGTGAPAWVSKVTSVVRVGW